MSEDRKYCPLGLIEAELAIIIVLLSLILFRYYVDNEEEAYDNKEDNNEDNNFD